MRKPALGFVMVAALAIVGLATFAAQSEVTICNPTLDPHGAGARGLTKVIGDVLV